MAGGGGGGKGGGPPANWPDGIRALLLRGTLWYAVRRPGKCCLDSDEFKGKARSRRRGEETVYETNQMCAHAKQTHEETANRIALPDVPWRSTSTIAWLHSAISFPHAGKDEGHQEARGTLRRRFPCISSLPAAFPGAGWIPNAGKSRDVIREGGDASEALYKTFCRIIVLHLSFCFDCIILWLRIYYYV